MYLLPKIHIALILEQAHCQEQPFERHCSGKIYKHRMIHFGWSPRGFICFLFSGIFFVSFLFLAYIDLFLPSALKKITNRICQRAFFFCRKYSFSGIFFWHFFWTFGLKIIQNIQPLTKFDRTSSYHLVLPCTVEEDILRKGLLVLLCGWRLRKQKDCWTAAAAAAKTVVVDTYLGMFKILTKFYGIV